MNKIVPIALGLAGLLLMSCETSSTNDKADSGGASATTSAKAPANETLGFVISAWRDEIPRNVEGGCPDGLNITEADHYKVDIRDFYKRAKEIGMDEASAELYGGDACKDRTSQPDPGYRSFGGPTTMDGLDLDGKDSRKDSGEGCAHNDFVGPNGETGIDNQHWRLMGCTLGYQPDGQMDRMWASGNFIKEGIPMLIEITGVDDRRNDPEVEVRLMSSGDSVSVDSNGQVVPQLSMQEHPNARYHNTPTRGRIEDGILYTEPTDLWLRVKQQVIDVDFYYRDARIRAEVLPSGEIRGILGFYWDGDNFFDAMNNHTIGGRHSGRIGAHTRGYACAGMHYELDRVMDGHPDPETGKCTSMSTIIHFAAVPAFVIPAAEEVEAEVPAQQTRRSLDREQS